MKIPNLNIGNFVRPVNTLSKPCVRFTSVPEDSFERREDKAATTKKELLSKYVSQHPNCTVLEKFGTTIVYDKDQKMVAEFLEKKDTDRFYREYFYDGENIIKEVAKFFNGDLKYTADYEYDQDGVRVSLVRKDPSGRILYQEKGKYDMIKGCFRRFVQDFSLQVKAVYEYNSESESLVKRIKKTPSYHEKETYNADGGMKNYIKKDATGNIIYKSHNVYDHEGQLLEIIIKDKEGKSIEKYNRDGQMEYVEKRDYLGNLIKLLKIQRDRSGKVIKSFEQNKIGSFECEYNANGRISSMIGKEEGDSFVYKIEYNYDQAGKLSTTFTKTPDCLLKIFYNDQEKPTKAIARSMRNYTVRSIFDSEGRTVAEYASEGNQKPVFVNKSCYKGNKLVSEECRYMDDIYATVKYLYDDKRKIVTVIENNVGFDNDSSYNLLYSVAEKLGIISKGYSPHLPDLMLHLKETPSLRKALFFSKKLDLYQTKLEDFLSKYRITTTLYEDGRPNEKTEVDANKNFISEKKYQYNAKGMLGGSIETDRFGITRKIYSGNAEKFIKEIRYNEEGNVEYINEYEYDKAGNIVREINKDAENEVKEITKYIYDEKGNLIKVEHPEV